MRRWTVIAAVFAVGMALTVAGFVVGGDAMACQVSGLVFCPSDPAAEELVYAGLALVVVAVMSAVVTVARRA